MRRGLVVVLALAVLPAAALAARPKPRVTVIGDSVGASLAWDATATRVLEQGVDARLELKGCRRLTTTSCPAGTEIPESALTLIHRLGTKLGPNVVIVVGYNDYPTVYAAGIEPVLRALRAARVHRVFWVTLHAANVPYTETNQAILGAARRHPDEVTVIDWNRCAAGHPGWFDDDAVHLSGLGAQGLARCIRDGVLQTLNAPPPIDVWLDTPLGVTVGFHAQLHAAGGHAPYRFAVRGLPSGLRVSPSGRLTGTLRNGRFRLHVHVRDGRGRTADVVTPLEISGGSR